MAIYGTLKDILNMDIADKGVRKGLEYIRDTDLNNIFADIEMGKSKVVELDGKDLFVVCSRYKTKTDTPPAFEGHRKYIDVQYITEGEELILITSDGLENMGEYDKDIDFQLCESESYSTLLMIPGYVSILFPSDWHAPCRQSIENSEIRKVVVKVAVK